jgi:formylglycine-generating enzyme required for sulfatase activity
VWAEADWEFSIGTEGELAGQTSATVGFESSQSLAFGTKFRNGQWTPYSSQSSQTVPYPATWQAGGSGRIRGFVEPKLTIFLESLAGPTANLRPYLELTANACVQPGQVGVDASLYAGLSGTVGVDLRFWDSDWATLPSWELFDPRALIWHQSLTTPSGPAPTVAGNLVWIPCGTFTMGSPDSELGRHSNEGPQTQVTISQGFWMGKYAVTQAEYQSVMGTNPSRFTTQDGPGGNPIPPDLTRPVEQISWNDAVAYCAALTSHEQSAGRLPAGYTYRLPTNAEREYACRAGTTTPFHCGNELRSGMANFYGYYEYLVGDPYHSNPSGAFLGRTTSVGSYAPNAWGLYDMHGNVWEWCQDWYGPYPGGSVSDPQGPGTGSDRVVRGGSWGNNAIDCRSAMADHYPPTSAGSIIGFRVVLAPGQP